MFTTAKYCARGLQQIQYQTSLWHLYHQTLTRKEKKISLCRVMYKMSERKEDNSVAPQANSAATLRTCSSQKLKQDIQINLDIHLFTYITCHFHFDLNRLKPRDCLSVQMSAAHMILLAAALLLHFMQFRLISSQYIYKTMITSSL